MVINQAYLFLIFIINGIIIGFIFDFFRIIRKTFKTADIVTYIQDLLFWILTGLIILYSTFTFNNGEIRIFMFVGILIGLILYMTLISSYIIKINVTIINFIKNILIKTINIILAPFKATYNILEKICKKIYKKLLKIPPFFTKKTKNIIKN